MYKKKVGINVQVKFNTNINQSRPSFKASFANTPETKKALISKT